MQGSCFDNVRSLFCPLSHIVSLSLSASYSFLLTCTQIIHLVTLGDDQWAWLDAELAKDSEIKVIASGIQALQPVNANTDYNNYINSDPNPDSNPKPTGATTN